MTSHVVWFDVPCLDLERAIRFYSAVLDVAIEKSFPGMKIGVLKHDNTGVSGCLFEHESEKPSTGGPILYFNASGRLDEAIAQVEANGGKILKQKHQIGPFGFRAIVLDSEGNRIALHSA